MHFKNINIYLYKKLILSFLLAIVTGSIKAQTGLLYYQNYNNSLNFNSASTGIDSITKLGLYWQKEDQNSETGVSHYKYKQNSFDVFIESYVPSLKGSVALIVTDKLFEDKSGSKNKSYVNLAYARGFKLNNWVLSTGIKINVQHLWLHGYYSTVNKSIFYADASIGVLLRNSKIIDFGIAYNQITHPVDLPTSYTNSDFKYYRKPAFLLFQLGKAITVQDKTTIYTEVLHTYEFATSFYKSIQTSTVNLNVKHKFFVGGLQVIYSHYFSSLNSINFLIGVDVKQLRVIYNAGLLIRSNIFDPRGECYGLSAIYRFKNKRNE